jgi:hypothetical protein
VRIPTPRAAALNPFVYDKPLAADELIGRDEELRLIVDHTTSGQNCRLSSPRRYGKTSLLKKVARRAVENGMPAAYVDLSGVLTIDDIASRIDDAYGTSLKRVPRRVLDWFRTHPPRLSGGLPFVTVGIDGASAVQAAKLLRRTLNVPLSRYERTGVRCLVILDEFQDLLRADEAVDGLIRSVIQHHRLAASYIFAGSHPGLMNELFSHQERPLYGQARPLTLGPLGDRELETYLKRCFLSEGRSADAAVENLVRLVRGHPQRAMLLAHHLWEQSTRGGVVDVHAWDAACEIALAELEDSFRYVWDQFGDAEKEALRALAVNKGAAQFVVERLQTAGQVTDTPGDPRLVDPLLEVWIARLPSEDLRDGRGPGRLGVPILGNGVETLSVAEATEILELIPLHFRDWPRSWRERATKGTGGRVNEVAEMAVVARNLTVQDVGGSLPRAQQDMLARTRRFLTQELAIALDVTERDAEVRVSRALDSVGA